MDNFDESSTDYMSPGCLESDDVVYDEQYGCSDSPLEASLNVEPSLKRKKILKVCRHYSYNLIGGAVEAGWEGHELANLIKLVSCQLGLDGSKLIKLLERTGTGTPDIVCQLMEQQEHGSSTTGCCSFSTPQLVAVFLSTAKNIEHFINIMEQAFEYDLFSLSSPDTLEVLHSFTVDAMDYRQTQRYARAICEHSGSKANCGRVLRQFSSSLPTREAPHFVFEVISLDFFRDLTGTVQQFLRELGSCVGDAVDGLLSEAHDRDGDGEIVESDADSHGDLKDFIAPDDDESNGELDADSEAESLNRSDDDGDVTSHVEEQRGRVRREDSLLSTRRRRRRKEEESPSPHQEESPSPHLATATAAAPPTAKRRRLLSNSNRTQSPDSSDEDVFHDP